MNLPGKTGNY